MPHPVKDPTGLVARGGPGTLMERPQLAAYIGAVAAEWGSIDNLLKEIFNSITLAKPIKGGAQRVSILADTIFSNFVTYHSRIQTIESVMKLRMASDICEEFDKLGNQTRRQSSIRNNLVHIEWQVCDAFPDDLITIKDEKWIRYTEPDLLHILNLSVDLRNLVSDFSIKVFHAPKSPVD